MTSPIVTQDSQRDKTQERPNSFLGDPTDAMRDMFAAMLQSVMEHDVDGILGAGRYQRNAERIDVRNGSRQRRFDTRMGTLNLDVLACERQPICQRFSSIVSVVKKP